MEDKNFRRSISDLFNDFLSSYLENNIVTSERVENIVSEKIKEIQLDVEENDIHEVIKKLGYKMNTKRLKKAELDFKVRQIMISSLKKKNFKTNVERRVSVSSVSSLFAGVGLCTLKEDTVLEKLEELIRQATIEELFFQIKKNNFILNNITFEAKKENRVKSIMLRIIRYIKFNWKGISYDIIKNVLIKLIVNAIAKLENRSTRNSCYYFV